MVDPDYGVEHSGNTPAGETLITLNGGIKRARLDIPRKNTAQSLAPMALP